MNVKITYINCRFRTIPANPKKPERGPLGIVEFMGGSQMVQNQKLFPDCDQADEIDCEGYYMTTANGTQLRVGEIVDVRKAGKSIVKEFKTA